MCFLQDSSERALVLNAIVAISRKIREISRSYSGRNSGHDHLDLVSTTEVKMICQSLAYSSASEACSD